MQHDPFHSMTRGCWVDYSFDTHVSAEDHLPVVAIIQGTLERVNKPVQSRLFLDQNKLRNEDHQRDFQSILDSATLPRWD
eukprot:4514222-Pyramimonas_sp.AAC.1